MRNCTPGTTCSFITTRVAGLAFDGEIAQIEKHVSKIDVLLLSFFLVSAFGAALSDAQAMPGSAPAATSAPAGSAPVTDDWLTYGYDPERTGWNRGETTLKKTTSRSSPYCGARCSRPKRP